MNSIRNILKISKNNLNVMNVARMSSDKGGKAGAIREAGGAFGKMEAAREDEFFYKQQKQQLAQLKNELNNEIGFHEEQIKQHQEAIKRHKDRVQKLDS